MKAKILNIFFTTLLFLATFPVGFATVIVDKPYGSEPPWFIFIIGGVACAIAISLFWQLGFAILLITKVKSAYRMSLLVFLFLLVILGCTVGLQFPRPYQKYKRKRFMHEMRHNLSDKLENKIKSDPDASALTKENAWLISSCAFDKFDDDNARVEEAMKLNDPEVYFMRVVEEEGFLEDCIEERGH